MGKCITPFCLYEKEETIEDAEHTFFHCLQWREARTIVEEITERITTENIVEKRLRDDENWNAVATYCEHVLRTKKQYLDSA